MPRIAPHIEEFIIGIGATASGRVTNNSPRNSPSRGVIPPWPNGLWELSTRLVAEWGQAEGKDGAVEASA